MPFNCRKSCQRSGFEVAYNVGRIGEEADAQMFIGIQMFKIITNA